MKKLSINLNNFWFAPLPASRLAILRIVTGLFSLWYLLYRFDMLMNLPKNELSMYEPVGLMKLFAAPFSEPLFNVIFFSTIFLNIAYTAGWKFKVTGPLFAVMLLLFFSYRNSWSMIYHNYIALVLHILIIGFAPSANALSVDAGKTKGADTPTDTHWQYGWPVKLICLGTAITYFICGIAKLTGNLAWDWLSGNAMRSQVAVDTLRKNVMGESTSVWFEWLYGHSSVFFLMGVMTMAVELSIPFILHKKRLVYTWVALALLMHWGIFFIMGIRFYHHMTGILFLPFLAPEKWWHYLKQKFLFRPSNVNTINKPAIVLFDGVCNFCDNTVRFIIDRDPKAHFHFASLQSAVAEDLLKHYKIPGNLSSIILIENNRVYTKSTAVLKISRRLNGLWKLMYLLIIIPASLRNMAYNLFAKNRYLLFGKKETCEIPAPEISKRFLQTPVLQPGQ